MASVGEVDGEDGNIRYKILRTTVGVVPTIRRSRLDGTTETLPAEIGGSPVKFIQSSVFGSIAPVISFPAGSTIASGKALTVTIRDTERDEARRLYFAKDHLLECKVIQVQESDTAKPTQKGLDVKVVGLTIEFEIQKSDPTSGEKSIGGTVRVPRSLLEGRIPNTFFMRFINGDISNDSKVSREESGNTVPLGDRDHPFLIAIPEEEAYRRCVVFIKFTPSVEQQEGNQQKTVTIPINTKIPVALNLPHGPQTSVGGNPVNLNSEADVVAFVGQQGLLGVAPNQPEAKLKDAVYDKEYLKLLGVQNPSNEFDLKYAPVPITHQDMIDLLGQLNMTFAAREPANRWTFAGNRARNPAFTISTIDVSKDPHAEVVYGHALTLFGVQMRAEGRHKDVIGMIRHEYCHAMFSQRILNGDDTITPRWTKEFMGSDYGLPAEILSRFELMKTVRFNMFEEVAVRTRDMLDEFESFRHGRRGNSDSATLVAYDFVLFYFLKKEGDPLTINDFMQVNTREGTDIARLRLDPLEPRLAADITTSIRQHMKNVYDAMTEDTSPYSKLLSDQFEYVSPPMLNPNKIER
jgi:hypothetical protein